MQAINFARLLKPVTQQQIEEKKIYLPKKDGKFQFIIIFISKNLLMLIGNKKTIVFDLDETLIHCNESTQIPSDIILPIKFPTGEIIEVKIILSFFKFRKKKRFFFRRHSFFSFTLLILLTFIKLIFRLVSILDHTHTRSCKNFPSPLKSLFSLPLTPATPTLCWTT